MTDVSGNGSVMRLAYIPILYREELIKGKKIIIKKIKYILICYLFYFYRSIFCEIT